MIARDDIGTMTPRSILLVSLHKSRRRGPVHAMPTAAADLTGGTDLWVVLEDRCPPLMSKRSPRRVS